jgi:hypothetical protein
MWDAVLRVLKSARAREQEVPGSEMCCLTSMALAV